MEIIRAYRYRLFPTAEQDKRLREWQHQLRTLWNKALEQYNTVVERPKASRFAYPNYYTQCKEITELRAMLPNLADVPIGMCQAVVKDLETAWKRCWKGKGLVGAPRFKSKNRGDTVAMRVPDPAMIDLVPVRGSVKNRGHLKFPKLGKIDCAVYRPLTGKPLLASITMEVGGEWWVSIPCRVIVPDPVLPNPKPLVAIDRGVVNILADSNGRLVVNPRFVNQAQPRVRRIQRSLRKQVNGGKNKERNRNRLSRLQRKVRRQRDHILQVESKWYANNHGVIILEKLGVRGMMKSAKGTKEAPGTRVRQKAGLNRALADSGMTRYVTLLLYKTVVTGAEVRFVTAAYSSQECAKCGHVSAENRVSQSKFKCVACGHEANADTNAAEVLKGRGFNGLQATEDRVLEALQ